MTIEPSRPPTLFLHGVKILDVAAQGEPLSTEKDAIALVKLFDRALVAAGLWRLL